MGLNFSTRRALFGVSGYREKVLSTGPIAYWMEGEPGGAVALCEVLTTQNGTHLGPDLGQAGIGDGRTSAYYDTTDSTNVYSVIMSGRFNGQTGSVIAWARVFNVGVWTDLADRGIVGLYADANNFLRIYRSSTNNRIIYRYRANAVTETITLDGLTTVDWMFVGMTWDLSAGVDGEVRAYYAGAQTGATQTSLGTWAGALNANSCTIGAVDIVPSQPWYGYIAHVALYNTVLTAAQMAALFVF